MAPFLIRTFGDPVLKQRSKPVEEIDGALAKTCDAMIETMLDAIGGGLAAPQVGIQRRFFVYGTDEEPRVAINPEIAEARGEQRVEEGCLSLPGISLEIVRPAEVTLRALDLDGNEFNVDSIDDYQARMFAHEIDHLDGLLAIDRADPETRKRDLKELREQTLAEQPLSASIQRL